MIKVLNEIIENLNKYKHSLSLMSRFLKKILNYSDIKQKYSEYVLNNCDIRQGIETIEGFVKKQFLLISNLDEYCNNEKMKKSRIFWVTFYRICFIIWFLTCSIAPMTDNETVMRL